MGTKEGFHGYGRSRATASLKRRSRATTLPGAPQLAEDEDLFRTAPRATWPMFWACFDTDNTCSRFFDPVLPTYVDDNVTDGRNIIYGRTSQEGGFLGMPDDSVKADIIYICSPNNPTGAAYTGSSSRVGCYFAKKNDAVHPVRRRCLRVLHHRPGSGPQHL